MEGAVHITIRSSNGKLIFDPVVITRSGPPFSFSEEEEKAIAEIVGQEKIEGIRMLADAYLARKKHYDSLNSKEEMDKLFEIGEKTEELTRLLSDLATRNNLLTWAGMAFGDEHKQMIAGTTLGNKTYPPPPLPAVKKLEEINTICELVRKAYKPDKPGRKRGSGDKAAYALVEGLYPICSEVNKGSLTTKPGNLLEQIIIVLNKPLKLGGTLPGITRKVIEHFAKNREVVSMLTYSYDI